MSDLEIKKIEAWFVGEPDGAECECARCHGTFRVEDELEMSRFCHNCAHQAAEEALPWLLEEIRERDAIIQALRRERESLLLEMARHHCFQWAGWARITRLV